MPSTNNIATNTVFARYYNASGMGVMQAGEQRNNQPSAYSWHSSATVCYYSSDTERELAGDKITDLTYITSPNGLVAAIKTTGAQHDVIPTPGIDGAGLQRIIIGNGGEIYYTPDHYETFYRIK